MLPNINPNGGIVLVKPMDNAHRPLESRMPEGPNMVRAGPDDHSAAEDMQKLLQHEQLAEDTTYSKGKGYGIHTENEWGTWEDPSGKPNAQFTKKFDPEYVNNQEIAERMVEKPYEEYKAARDENQAALGLSTSEPPGGSDHRLMRSAWTCIYKGTCATENAMRRLRGDAFHPKEEEELQYTRYHTPVWPPPPDIVKHPYSGEERDLVQPSAGHTYHLAADPSGNDGNAARRYALNPVQAEHRRHEPVVGSHLVPWARSTPDKKLLLRRRRRRRRRRMLRRR